MGRFAVDGDGKITAARPCAGQRAIGQGWFIGEGRRFPLGKL